MRGWDGAPGEVKSNGKVKGNGQECPFHTSSGGTAALQTAAAGGTPALQTAAGAIRLRLAALPF